ncbi:MAG TPA: methylmalonyl Co-A mutase-associated GTPase MeaB [Chitinophagaceae bacterium]
MWQQLLEDINNGEVKGVARAISFIENEEKGFEELLRSLPENTKAQIIGVTGPPGAGKSTLVDGLISEMIAAGKKVAVLCVDPSSPFNLGALLGDRIRMSSWYTHTDVFIRSLATRGSLGGMHPKIIEITELAKAAGFEYIIVETVGVGQSEVEIAGLADTTVVVLVPEGGDEVQTMKAGVMEIADIFVVNKSDRPGADGFIKNLRQMLAPAFSTHAREIPIIKTVASEKKGLKELFEAIEENNAAASVNKKKSWLLAEKAYYIIQNKRIKDISKDSLRKDIEERMEKGKFNLYQFTSDYI